MNKRQLLRHGPSKCYPVLRAPQLMRAGMQNSPLTWKMFAKAFYFVMCEEPNAWPLHMVAGCVGCERASTRDAGERDFRTYSCLPTETEMESRSKRT